MMTVDFEKLKSRRLPLWVVACLCFGCMIGSCAKQGFPPGGPVDETAPELLWSIPELNATNVPKDKSIVFGFSELMDEESVEENVFIIPIPEVWPSLSWQDRGRTLVITPAGPLEDNTTYVISIGAKASDRQRNTFEESIVLCFSTGNTIENRRITGRILPLSFTDEAPEKVSEVDVIAYRLDKNAPDPDPGNDVPDFFTQTGSDGTYELAGLSQGIFRLFAVGDKDGDGFYTAGYDMIGIAPHDIEFAEEDTLVTAPDITLTMRYAADVQLNSIRVPDNRRIELFFDHPVDPESLHLEIDDLDVHKWTPESGKARSISVLTNKQEKKRYTITAIDIWDHDGNGLMEMDMQPFFDGTDRPDTSALKIVSIDPDVLTGPAESVSLTFNRILDDTDGLDGLIEHEGGETIRVTRSAPDELTLTPVERWHNDMNYIILLDRDRVHGAAGNRMTETGAQVEFRVVPEDTLSSISGTLAGNVTSEADCRLFLHNLDLDLFREIECSSDANWSTGPVLPGNFLIHAFCDYDGDGKIFPGTLKPFKAAEPVTMYPDTIVVESRWPVEDIHVEFK